MGRSSWEGLQGVACALGLCLVASFLSAAREPDGLVALTHGWVGPSEPGRGTPVLRLVIEAGEPISAADLLYEPAPGLLVEPRAIHRGGESTGAGTLPPRTPGRIALGDLAPGTPIVVEFDVVPPAAGGRILAFHVVGSAPGGRTFREGTGVFVGEPAGAPSLRDGAAEFPAVQLPRGQAH